MSVFRFATLFSPIFIPATGDVIQGYIEQFVANSSRMTAVGAFGLIVTISAADVFD
jgi:uncharacterized BrkB/YihY/UPF0761 family membrane protein